MTPRKEEHKYWCQDCEEGFFSDEAKCTECGGKNVGIDEPTVQVPKVQPHTEETCYYCKAHKQECIDAGNRCCPNCKREFFPHTDQFEEIRQEFFGSFITVPEDSEGVNYINKICEWWLSKLHHIRRETEKGMMEKAIAVIHSLEESYPQRESDEYDAGMKDMKRKVIATLFLESDNSTQK